MQNRISVGLAVLLILLIGIIAWGILREREPLYQGKGLTVWVSQYSTNRWPYDKGAESAVRHFGAHAVPIFLKMMDTREFPLRLKMTALVPNKWLTRLHIATVAEYKQRVDRRRALGAYGFAALGVDAEPAVPALMAMLNDKDVRVRYHAVFALRCLGPVASAALPSLIKCLSDPEFTVRDDAVLSMGTIHQEPERVVPILVQCVETNSTETIIRCDAVGALGMFGAQAKAAVPILVVLLNDEHAGVRSAATNALLQIDPGAAAKAGVK